MNLHTTSFHNIKKKRCKILDGFIIYNTIISAAENKALLSDIASVIMSRKTKNSLAYEFNFQMSHVPAVIKALQYIVHCNPTFYSNMKTDFMDTFDDADKRN